MAGYDAIVTDTSTLAIAQAINKVAGKGIITHILPLSEDTKKALPPTVEAKMTIVSSAHLPEKDEACTYTSFLDLIVQFTDPGGTHT